MRHADLIGEGDSEADLVAAFQIFECVGALLKLEIICSKLMRKPSLWLTVNKIQVEWLRVWSVFP